MGTFVYTATEDLIGGRQVGEVVVLDVGVQEARRSRKTEKSVQRSDGGAIEVLKHRSDVTWSITLEPVSGHQLSVVREFLSSTEGGERFTMDIYGSASAPKSVKRLDDGYDEEPFIRQGAEDLDFFVVSFQVIQL